jgi:ribosomal protein L11 methylase PrmA
LVPRTGIRKDAPVTRTTQLRTYTVRDGLLGEWAQRWQEEVVPLRLKWGFDIGGAWVDRERNQFLWLISYEGTETFAERNALYWASPARKAMSLDPDDYLLHTEERTVDESYRPRP